MELNNIKHLIDKYLAGETTAREENELREFFCSGNVPEQLKVYSFMFGFFRDEHSRLEQALRHTTVPDYKKNEGHVAVKVRTGRRFYRFMTTAVSVAAVLLVALIVFNMQNQGDASGMDDYNEPYCYVNGQPVTDLETAIHYASFAAEIFEETMSETKQSLESLDLLADIFNTTDKY